MAILDNLQIKATGDTTSAQRSLTALIKKYEKLTKVAKEAQGAMGGTTGGGGGGETPTKSIKKMDDAAKKATKSMGGLFASIKRIAFYRLIRSLVKEVTSGFSEGVKAAYAWAEANNDAFKQVMDRYATRTNYLKNTLGALGATVLTALLPAFISFTNVLIKGINYVTEFIAAIAGADEFYRAKEVMVEFGDAADNAAGAQKKLNQQLMAFDELNVITTPKSSGKDDSTNWQDAFEKVAVSSKMAQNGKKVRDVLERIKNTLSPIFDLIKDNAPKVGEIVVSIANGLDRLMDNLPKISPELQEIIRKMVDIGIDALPGAIDAVTTAVDGLIEMIQALFGLSPQGVNPIKQALGGLAKVFLGVWEACMLAMAGIADFVEYLRGDENWNHIEQAKADFNQAVSWIDSWVYGTGEAATTAKKGTSAGKTGGGSQIVKRDPIGQEYAISAVAKAQAAKNKLGILNDERDRLTYASGGFPSMGSVFVAGEVPGQSEMVGTINGRTGVASGEEITGISEAVYSTGGETAALLRQLIAVVSDGGSMRPSAAFGRFASESLRLYKGVTG